MGLGLGFGLRLGRFKFGLRLGEVWGDTGRNGEIRGDVAGLARSSELRRTQRLSCAWLFSTWVGLGFGFGLGLGLNPNLNPNPS